MHGNKISTYNVEFMHYVKIIDEKLYFYFLFYFLFLEQLGLGLISHTSHNLMM